MCLGAPCTSLTALLTAEPVQTTFTILPPFFFYIAEIIIIRESEKRKKDSKTSEKEMGLEFLLGDFDKSLHLTVPFTVKEKTMMWQQ